MLSFTFESIHHSSRKLCYLSLLRVYIFSLKNILCTRGYIQLDIILNFSKYIYKSCSSCGYVQKNASLTKSSPLSMLWSP